MSGIEPPSVVVYGENTGRRTRGLARVARAAGPSCRTQVWSRWSIPLPFPDRVPQRNRGWCCARECPAAARLAATEPRFEPVFQSRHVRHICQPLRPLHSPRHAPRLKHAARTIQTAHADQPINLSTHPAADLMRLTIGAVVIDDAGHLPHEERPEPVLHELEERSQHEHPPPAIAQSVVPVTVT